MLFKVLIAELIALLLLALPAAAQQVNLSPPKTVWDSDLDGTAIHTLSGLQCPNIAGDFRRNQLALYDRVGFDVSCNYFGSHGAITIYLTHRDPALLQESFEGAKNSITNYPGTSARNSVLPPPIGTGWLQAGFTRKEGALDTDLFLKSLSGWDFKIRATYRTSAMPMVTAALTDLSTRVANTAGTHLAACAGLLPPARPGKAVNGDGAMILGLTMSGVLLSQTSVAEPDAGAIWCAETGLAIGGKPSLYWRNIAVDPKGAVDRITSIDSDFAVVIFKDSSGASLAREMAPTAGFTDIYELFVIDSDTITLAGIFDERPSLETIAKLLTQGKAFARTKKTDKSTTVFYQPTEKR